MPHRIVTGPFSALEPRLAEEIASRQGSDRLAPAIVLVGSNLLAVYLRRRFALDGRAFVNLRTLNFLDLVACLAGPSGALPAKPALPRLGASEILDAVLRSRTPPAFTPVAHLPGFRQAVLDTFRDLRDAGVSPADLDRGVRESVEADPDRTAHLAALLRIYRDFRRRIEAFRDVDDDFRKAVAGAERAASLLGSARLSVYGLYDATGGQLDLLEALSRSMDLHLFIPYRDEAVSGFARPFLQACRRMLETEPEALAPVLPVGDLGALWRANLGFGPLEPFTPEEDGSLRLVSAPGDSRAAVEIVREVLHAARDGVIRGFHEAAVILRHPDTDAPVLAEAFRLRGVPCYNEAGNSLARRMLGRSVLALVALEGESFSRQAILKAMELVAAALPAEAAASWQVSDWYALTNAPRFLSGVRSWDEASQNVVREAENDLERITAGAAADSGLDEDGERILSADGARKRLGTARALQAAWCRIRDASAGWPAAASWQEWASLLENRFRPLLGESREWEEFSRAVDEIAALGRLAGTAGRPEATTRARFAAVLTSSLEALVRPEGRLERNGVHLLSTAAARGLRFPLVIVPGLEEGGFPARARQDPLLLDEERRRVGRPARLPLRSLRAEEEKLLFDLAACAAAKRLVLVTSRLDEASDRERIPSLFFLRAASALCGKTIGVQDLRSGGIPLFRSVGLDSTAPAAGLPAVDDAEIRLRLITAEPGLARAALEEIARHDPALLARPMACDLARWQRELTEYDGRIRDPRLRAWLVRNAGPASGPLSASILEEYARCPYRYYLHRVIGIEGWEEQEPPMGLDPIERGSLVHDVLERFLSRLPEKGLQTMDAAGLERELLAAARSALLRAQPPGLPDLLWDLEQEQVERLLAAWLGFERERRAEGFVPERFEWPFGSFAGREDNPALMVKAGRHQFVIRGRIDRVDFEPGREGARVIDYKTGRLPKTMAEGKRLLMAGEKMQIALYREALARTPGGPAPGAIRGEYLHLQPQDGTIVSCPFSPEELEEASRRLVSILEVIGDGIERGIFPHRPAGTVFSSNCDYCDYLPVCGKERESRAERKSVDPEAAVCSRLAEIDPPQAGEA